MREGSIKNFNNRKKENNKKEKRINKNARIDVFTLGCTVGGLGAYTHNCYSWVALYFYILILFLANMFYDTWSHYVYSVVLELII